MAKSRRLLRVATAVAGAAALGLTFAGTAYADSPGDREDSAYSSDDSPNEDSGEAADEDTDADSEDSDSDSADSDSTDSTDSEHGNSEPADSDPEDSEDSDSADADAPDEDPTDQESDQDPADGDGAGPPKKKVQKDGLYGVDTNPGTLIQNNLDGETESPGIHKKGIGTVEVPRIATHP